MEQVVSDPNIIIDTFDLDHPPTAPTEPEPTQDDLDAAQTIFDRVAARQK